MGFFKFVDVLVRVFIGDQTDNFKWEKVKKEEIEKKKKKMKKKKEGKEEGSVANLKSTVCDFLSCLVAQG